MAVLDHRLFDQIVADMISAFVQCAITSPDCHKPLPLDTVDRLAVPFVVAKANEDLESY